MSLYSADRPRMTIVADRLRRWLTKVRQSHAKKLYREVSKGKAPVRLFILKMAKRLKKESRYPDLTWLLLPVEYAHM